MKKVVSLILALMMCLSLCACGETQKQYSFGESITTDMFVFTPHFDGFSKELSNWNDENIMTPNGGGVGTSRNPYEADSGKVMMYFSGTVEYIGNSKENEWFKYTATANFDNGYIYTADSSFGCAYTESKYLKGWEFGNSFRFEPLADNQMRNVRFHIEVPEQVEKGTDKSLIVTFNISGKDYTYRIR